MYVVVSCQCVYDIIYCWSVSAGCHVIAPSDMMDNRVAAIKTALQEAGLGGKVGGGTGHLYTTLSSTVLL